jgi:HAD superfamily hydrolase (TIGR01450 family)
VRLDRARGFVFDIDGTLVHRDGHEIHPIPGAVEVLERIAASGRPYALFTNGSHQPPDAFVRELRAAGLPLADGQVITPLCSARGYLERLGPTARVLVFGTAEARSYLRDAGHRVVDGDGEPIDVVLVAHTNHADLDEIERGAWAAIAGARLLTGNYVPAYAGASGPILSRGAMVTAAIAKASGRRPIVVGKPSGSAVREMTRRLGVPSEDLVVVGDDVQLDIALGRRGGSSTVLVRSGISASLDADALPAGQRPHSTVASVAELLTWL